MTNTPKFKNLSYNSGKKITRYPSALTTQTNITHQFFKCMYLRLNRLLDVDASILQSYMEAIKNPSSFCAPSRLPILGLILRTVKYDKRVGFYVTQNVSPPEVTALRISEHRFITKSMFSFETLTREQRVALILTMYYVTHERPDLFSTEDRTLISSLHEVVNMRFMKSRRRERLYMTAVTKTLSQRLDLVRMICPKFYSTVALTDTPPLLDSKGKQSPGVKYPRPCIVFTNYDSAGRVRYWFILNDFLTQKDHVLKTLIEDTITPL